MTEFADKLKQAQDAMVRVPSWYRSAILGCIALVAVFAFLLGLVIGHG